MSIERNCAAALLTAVFALTAIAPAQAQSVNFATANPVTMNCSQIAATAKAIIAEGDFVRAERKRLKDNNFYSQKLTYPEAEDLMNAMNYRNRALNCPQENEQPLSFARMNVPSFQFSKNGVTLKPTTARVDALIATTNNPAQYARMLQCQQTYMVAAHGDHYAGDWGARGGGLINAANAASVDLSARASKLDPRYESWKGAYSQVAARPFVYAKIHDKVAACDKDLGYKIRSLLPAGFRAPTKPAVRPASFTAEKLGSANCDGLKSFAKAMSDEVEYVRERRFEAGDSTIKSDALNGVALSKLVSAADKRAKQVGCEGISAGAFSMLQFRLGPFFS